MKLTARKLMTFIGSSRRAQYLVSLYFSRIYGQYARAPGGFAATLFSAY